MANSKKLAWEKRQREVLELRRQLAERDRTLRIYAAREQDLSERYQVAPDADGIGGRPAVVVLRDKNVPYVFSIIDGAWTYPHMFGGWESGRRILREHLTVAIEALWVAPIDHPIKVALKHDLLRWVSDDGLLGLMMRDDSLGRAERSDLKHSVAFLAFGFSAPFAFQKSQEVMVEPVQAERRPQPA